MFLYQELNRLLRTDHNCNKTYDKTYNLKIIAATTRTLQMLHNIAALISILL